MALAEKVISFEIHMKVASMLGVFNLLKITSSQVSVFIYNFIFILFLIFNELLCVDGLAHSFLVHVVNIQRTCMMEI